MKKFFFLVLIFFAFFIPVYSLGVSSCPDQVGLCETAQAASMQNGDISVFVGNIIKGIISVLGIIIFIFILYGGYLWLMSGGNEQMVKKSKEILTNATIGLIIVLAAYAITTFIMKGISGAISSSTASECMNADNNPVPASSAKSCITPSGSSGVCDGSGNCK